MMLFGTKFLVRKNVFMSKRVNSFLLFSKTSFQVFLFFSLYKTSIVSPFIARLLVRSFRYRYMERSWNSKPFCFFQSDNISIVQGDCRRRLYKRKRISDFVSVKYYKVFCLFNIRFKIFPAQKLRILFYLQYFSSSVRWVKAKPSLRIENKKETLSRHYKIIYLTMSTAGYQIRDQFAVHFLSFATVHRVAVFTRSNYADIIINSLKFCKQKKGLAIHAWCPIMCIWSFLQKAQQVCQISCVILKSLLQQRSSEQ